MIRKEICLGKMAGVNKEVFVSGCAGNPHILETGGSGAGKTYAMNAIERNIVNAGGACCVLDYGNTHSQMRGDQIVRWDVYDRGLPFPLFSGLTRPDGSQEDVEDVLDSIVNVFDCTSRLRSRQKAILRKAIQESLEGPSENMDLKGVARILEEEEGDVAQSVLDKFRSAFGKIRFCKSEETLLGKERILILDMSKFPGELQYLTSELALSILWRYFRVWGQYAQVPLYLVCDECQNLNLGKYSILAQILREGRKYNMALLLATQSLAIFSKQQIAMLMQAATQLYFRPAQNDVHTLARLIGAEDVKQMEQKLRKLSRGECIATGRFCVGAIEIEKPLTLRF